MTRIDFYILSEKARDNRYHLACRLADKAYQQGCRVLIHTASEQEAQHMDRLLWTFREGSFVPHGLSGKADPAATPVLIGHGEDIKEEHGVLINLHPEVPAFFSRFERLIEPIDRDDQVRDAGRRRFRFYRDRGYPLESHDIQQ
jgi:DNA polymerase-3 subunit chi